MPMLFCSVPAVAAVGIIISMTAKVTNRVGTTAAMMNDAGCTQVNQSCKFKTNTNLKLA